MRDLSDIILRTSDFHTLAELCYLDCGFPRDFASWNELITLAERQARGRNLFPVPLLLEPAEFREWCARVSMVPGIEALRAFSIVKRDCSAPVAPH